MADTKVTLAIDLKLLDSLSPSIKAMRASIGKLQSDARVLGRALTLPFRAPLVAVDYLANKVLSLRNLVAGLFVFRAAQAGLRELNQLTSELDHMAKLSDRLGATAESVTTLDYALKLSGTSLQELTPGLVTLERQLELARRGNAEAALSLRTLGIEINQVRTGNLDLVEILAQVADRYVQIGDQTTKLTALTTAFGEAGGKLGPLLKGGAEGVRAIAREAQQRGLVFTREELARAEAYQDALLRVSTAFRATFQRAFLDAAPAVSAFFERLAGFIDANRGKVIDLLESAGRVGARVLSVLGDGAIGLVAVLERIPGVVAVPEDIRREYFDLAAQLQAIDQLRRQGGIDQARRDAAAQPGFLKGLFPDAGKIRELGREFTIEFVDSITPKREEIQRRYDELAKQMPGQIAAALRKEKAALLEEVGRALTGSSSATTNRDTFRSILEQAGIRTDDDVIRAVGAGLISPEALLQGVQEGLFSSGVVDRIVQQVRGTVAKAVAQADPSAIQSQALQLRDLTALQRQLLELKQPTLDVRLALAALDEQAGRAELAQKFVPQLVDGKVSADLLAQAVQDLGDKTRRAMEEIRRGAEQDLVAFRTQLEQIGPQTRETRVELAHLQGRAQELSFREAAAQGRIDLQQLEEAIRRVREETERSVALARGDFGEGFKKGAREALDAFTDLSKLGEEAGRNLVDKGLGGLTDVLGTFLVNVREGKAAFRDWAADMLRLVGQLIAKWVALKAVQALGLGVPFAAGGVMPGRLLSVQRLPERRYASGGVANSPQVAIFGEGRQAEAFVPLPDGRSIPVTMRGGGGGGLTIVVQAIDSRDVSRFFMENRGTLWSLQTHGIEHNAALRQAVGGAR